MNSRLILPVWAVALMFSSSALHVRANSSAEAKFVVTDEVVRPADKVPPLGANNFGGRGVETAAGNYIANAGNERPFWQNLHRAVNVEGRSFQLDGLGGTSWYKLWADGFLSGAKVRIYRIVDKAGDALEVEKRPHGFVFKDIARADRVIKVGTGSVVAAGAEGFPKGGWIVEEPPEGKSANRVYLAEGAPELKPMDYIVLEKDFTDFDMGLIHSRVRGLMGSADRPGWWWDATPKDLRWSFAPHDGKAPAEMIDAGDSALLIEPAAGPVLIKQGRFASTDLGDASLYYTQLEPGKNHRLEVWLKQEGLADGGRVNFFIHPENVPDHQAINTSFTVTGAWKKYTYDFVAPERPTGRRIYGPAFSFTGPGRLWMENARLFRFDSPQDLEASYVPHAGMLKGLLDSQPETGPKGVHRVWVLERDITMESLLSLYPNSTVRPGPNTSLLGQNKDMSLPQALMFDLATGDRPATRMIPHIVIQHILHDEADWMKFVEYMAAPYDAKTDTPQSKPWAYKRYRQRGGNGTPWTEEFREIIVELGNETWHNGKFADWIGFSTYGAIHQGGPEYGLFADYLITQIKSSSWWAKQKLDGKMTFALGGNYGGRVQNGVVRGYGEDAMQRTRQAAYMGRANYVGPKWETGGKQLEAFDNNGLFSTIMGYQVGIKESEEEAFAARNLLAQRGFAYDLIAYEGGPSGYAITREARSNVNLVDAAERYGKSQAMAVASLDAWLGGYGLGWTHQAYLGYQQGLYWSSHTMLSDGFRPHASWLAMTLRNRFARGDLMKVDMLQAPTIEYADPKKPVRQVPLVGAYAMRDGKRWSVFVMSRKVDGTAMGTDFRDGYSAVSLKLPFKSAAKISLHKLAANPGANNIKSEDVKIETVRIDPRQDALSRYGTWTINEATGGGKGGLPPAAIYLYVFEDVK